MKDDFNLYNDDDLGEDKLDLDDDTDISSSTDDIDEEEEETA